MRRGLIVVAVLVVLGGGGVLAWQLTRSSSTTDGSPAGSAGSGASTAGSGLVVAEAPVAKALDAMQAISAPSVLAPLSSSTPGVGADTAYDIARPCTAVVAAYRNPKALPAGAHVVATTSNAVIVANRFGDRVGFVYRSTSRTTCEYTLAAQPTVQITGPSPIAGSYFAEVGCASLYDDPAKGLEGTTFTLQGSPWTVVVGTESGASKAPPDSAYRATIANQTPQQYAASGGNGKYYPVRLSDTSDGSIRAVLGGAATGTVVTLTCTADLGDVIKIFGK